MDIRIFEEIRSSENLPTPAGVGMKILQITKTEDFDILDMGRAIMADSSLTGRILQLANSSVNGGLQPATTVEESIMRLGSSTVRNLALAFSLISERKPGTCKAFDYVGYWSTSLARAVTARALATKMGVGQPEEAYICGLLSHIGRLAMASVFPEKYAGAIEGSLLPPYSDIKEIEQALFSINHVQVATCMATDWKLPEAFGVAIQQALEYPFLSPDEPINGTLADVLRLADAIAVNMALDESAPPEVWANTGEQFKNACLVLSLDNFDYRVFLDECFAEWVAWGNDLQIAIKPKRSTARLERLIADKTEEHYQVPTAKIAVSDGPNVAKAFRKLSETTVLRNPIVEESFVTRILLVDDDPVSLKLLEAQMHQQGYEILTATSGQEALKLALEHCPDIVVADWQMPEMDGLELCRALRRSADGSEMYFLMVTGSGGSNGIVEAFDAGVDDFVTKPFLPRVMAARIKGGERLVRLNRKVESDKQTMMRQMAELGVLTRKLRATTLTDALTDLPNRRYALKRLAAEWAAIERIGGNLTLMMLDIDDFKSVNDVYGHDIGDVVLRETASILKRGIRSCDEVCRIGGEEFLLICNNTSEEESVFIAERLRASVDAHAMPVVNFDRKLTISLGIAEYDSSMTSFNELLKFADAALYVAKKNGRNRFVRHSEIESAEDAA
ncbi:MAG: two-component system cell cycle response regulator [Planctomycetota bacterium]|jgi:two-component system cell cycle response regulator